MMPCRNGRQMKNFVLVFRRGNLIESTVSKRSFVLLKPCDPAPLCCGLVHCFNFTAHLLYDPVHFVFTRAATQRLFSQLVNLPKSTSTKQQTDTEGNKLVKNMEHLAAKYPFIFCQELVETKTSRKMLQGMTMLLHVCRMPDVANTWDTTTYTGKVTMTGLRLC